jgi:hypothetical protein
MTSGAYQGGLRRFFRPYFSELAGWREKSMETSQLKVTVAKEKQ